MNVYHGFFQREPGVGAAEAFEVPAHFPINLSALVSTFGTAAQST